MTENNNISYKINSYPNNNDLAYYNDCYITNHDGFIYLKNFDNNNMPQLIGEFFISTLNIEIIKQLNVNIINVFKNYTNEILYSELLKVIYQKELNIFKYSNIVIVQSLVIKKEYRKKKIFNDFVEMLFREYYNNNTLIILLVLPFQKNPIDYKYYKQKKQIIKTKSNDITINAFDYYNLYEFEQTNDDELCELKLFSHASKMGFSRISNTHIFILNKPNIIINQIINKSPNC